MSPQLEFLVWMAVGSLSYLTYSWWRRRRAKRKPCVPIKCDDWVETEVNFGSCLNRLPDREDQP